jgi:hypothetical protein
MANLRIQVEIQKGIRGVPLGKLAEIVGDLQRFLGMLNDDLGLNAAGDKWIGLDFENGSLSFVAEKADPVTVEQVVEFNTAFASIAERRPAPAIRRATIAQYAKIANPIDPEEAVSFQLYAPPSEPEEEDSSADDEWVSESEYRHGLPALVPLRRFDLTKSEATAIQSEVQGSVRAYGALQGRIHSLFLGSQPAYFNLRELSTGALVKCVYKPEIYPAIATALQRRNAVLHVYGYTETDLVQRKLEDMDVVRVDLAAVVTDEEFDNLFGSIPRFTGQLTTQEFINYARGRGN